jgi:hypothetical protein
VSVEIVGITSSHRYNSVPDASLNHLASLLKGLDANIRINAYGEAWGPSSTEPWSADTVASFVLADGRNVWIDWCGVPGWYQVGPSGAVTVQREAGWSALATALGYKWLAQAQFIVPGSDRALVPGGGGFPLSRGWDLGPSQNGVYYSALGNVSLAAVTDPFATSLASESVPGMQMGYALIADVHHEGMGHYLYVAAEPSYFGSVQRYVAAQSIADFLARMLALAKGSSETTAGIGHGGHYHVTALPPKTNPGGGPTPFQPPSGSPPKTGVGAPIDWRTVGLLAAGAAVVGGMGYYTVSIVGRGKRGEI